MSGQAEVDSAARMEAEKMVQAANAHGNPAKIRGLQVRMIQSDRHANPKGAPFHWIVYRHLQRMHEEAET